METLSDNNSELGDFSGDPENWGKVLVDGGTEIVKNILVAIKTKKYAFIGERQTIDLTRFQKKSKEMKIYNEYMPDSDNLILFEMGMSLRKLETEKDFVRLENLKDKIRAKYDIEGVHIAQTIQNKILLRYITELIEEGIEKDIIISRISKLISDIDSHVFFIQGEGKDIDTMRKINLKIEVNSPVFFVISGKGSAVKTIEEVSDEIKNKPFENYYISRHFGEKDAMIFLKRK